MNGCPSDGSKDDDVTTLEENEGAEGDLNDKVGNTASVGRRPCAVYDDESAFQPSTAMNSDESSSLLPQRSNVAGLEHDHHHATLDGLCHPSYHREAVRIDS